MSGFNVNSFGNALANGLQGAAQLGGRGGGVAPEMGLPMGGDGPLTLNALRAADPVFDRKIRREDAKDARDEAGSEADVSVKRAQAAAIEQETAFKAKEQARTMSAAEREKEILAIEGILASTAQAYQAGPEAFNAWVQSRSEAIVAAGLDPSQITYDTYMMWGAGLLGAKRGLEAGMGFDDMVSPQAEPQSPAGKFYADQNAGLIPEGEQFKSGGVTVNTGGPTPVGKDGWVMIPDPQSETGFRWEASPNSPAAAEASAREAQLNADQAVDRARSENEAVSGSIVDRDVDRLVSMIDENPWYDLPEAGIAGNLLARTGVNQEAVDFRNTLDGIQSTVAFDRLQRMREASKTGGALGAVSERELTLLINSLGAIQQSTSPELLRQNLLDIKRIMGMIENDPVASAYYYGREVPRAAAGGDGAARPEGREIDINGTRYIVTPVD